MVRKKVGILLGDITSYVTGSNPFRDDAEAADRWLHPVDCGWMLDDRERSFGPFDPLGLPMQQLQGIGTVYVPSRTAAYGFAHWNELRSGREDRERHAAAFMATANWFAAFPDGRILHEFPLLNLASPWLSALAQGEALSIFARAFLLTENPDWREHAERAIQWLATPVDAGGVLGALPDGSPFLEEYPGTRHAGVLNGCLYALAGLADAREMGVSDMGLVDRVADAVENNLRFWNRGGWSLYQWSDGSGSAANFNTPSYQQVHISLLTHLADTLGRPAFRSEANELRRGLASPALRIRALASKLRYRFSYGW